MMSSSKLSFLNLVAICAIILQLPLEYIHSMLFAFGYIDEVGMLKGIAKLSLFCFLMIGTVNVLFYITWSRGLKELLLFILFIISVSVITIYHLFSIDFQDIFDSIFLFYVQIIFLNLYCFMIGLHYPKLSSSVGAKLSVVFCFLYLCMITITLANVDLSRLQLDLNAISNYENKSMYLFWADALAIFSFFIICSVRHDYYKLIIIFTTTFMLYVLLSRTSLYLYVFVSFIYFFSKKNYVFLFFVGMSLILTLSMIGEDIIKSRMLAFLFSGDDSSWNSRTFMLMDGLNDIGKNFIFGRFAGQVTNFGEIGYYIHNMISYWRQYGVFVFLMMVALIFPLIRMCFMSIRGRLCFDDAEIVLIVIGSSFTLMSIFISRSFNYPYIFIMIGLYQGYKIRKMSCNRSSFVRA
ncbi:hypothetical protein GNP82_11210 [Aliivibrio fischeri]|uniref:hypothetical protein n=1 Tax=Aliivibrio fischeri TaxID=668 RepID=UPI0012D9F4D7|nr:hypothetical protein [Aliivibrio fischeri]MUK38120.1 hypothetical protein [Aliivibrio fischeri]MUL04027.1 hypothetical protein [Aliivibrio fischeri]